MFQALVNIIVDINLFRYGHQAKFEPRSKIAHNRGPELGQIHRTTSDLKQSIRKLSDNKKKNTNRAYTEIYRDSTEKECYAYSIGERQPFWHILYS